MPRLVQRPGVRHVETDLHYLIARAKHRFRNCSDPWMGDQIEEAAAPVLESVGDALESSLDDVRHAARTKRRTARKQVRSARRTAAKQARDFTTSDRIRDELKAEGILLEDGPGVTTWRRA